MSFFTHPNQYLKMICNKIYSIIIITMQHSILDIFSLLLILNYNRYIQIYMSSYMFTIISFLYIYIYILNSLITEINVLFFQSISDFTGGGFIDAITLRRFLACLFVQPF